jgi:hypothetical protein
MSARQPHPMPLQSVQNLCDHIGDVLGSRDYGQDIHRLPVARAAQHHPQRPFHNLDRRNVVHPDLLEVYAPCHDFQPQVYASCSSPAEACSYNNWDPCNTKRVECDKSSSTHSTRGKFYLDCAGTSVQEAGRRLRGAPLRRPVQQSADDVLQRAPILIQSFGVRFRSALRLETLNARAGASRSSRCQPAPSFAAHSEFPSSRSRPRCQAMPTCAHAVRDQHSITGEFSWSSRLSGQNRQMGKA